MGDEVKIALVGMGGYGRGYAQVLFELSAQHHAKLVAGIDSHPENCPLLGEFRQRNIPIFADLNQFYEKGSADLVVISSPIHCHAQHTIHALSQGSNVLCEKPLSGVVQDGLAMLAAERESGKFVAIGYQWSFSPPVLALKRDIQSGLLGQPILLKTKVFWPRSDRYYKRNQWAGCQKVDGRWALDSPVNNAAAHYLHNVFFILGSGMEPSASPVAVQSELYRAREIENYDTVALRCLTKSNVEILFLTTHATQGEIGPVLEYQFSEAVVTFDAGVDTGFVARFKDGKTKEYGNPSSDENHWRKIWDAVDSVRNGLPVACGIKAFLAQTACMNGAQESVKNITQFPDDMIQEEVRGGDRYRWVPGLGEVFDRCYHLGVLPSALGDISWAKPGVEIDLRNYRNFPSRGGRNERYLSM